MDNSNGSSIIRENGYLCSKNSSHQEPLYIMSAIYLVAGLVITCLLCLGNFLFILFFCASKKAKHSSLCICLFYLSLLNVFKLMEYYLTAAVKLKLNMPNSVMLCNIMHFCDRFSAHCSVYIIIFVQTQKYLLIRSRKIRFSRLVIWNYALAYLFCTGLLFFFIIFDEFYVYNTYFTATIYCPTSLTFTCVLNSKLQLLNSIKFNTLVYHHLHTLFYNIAPFILILIINIKILLRFKSRITSDNRSQDSPMSQSSSLTVSSIMCSTSRCSKNKQYPFMIGYDLLEVNFVCVLASTIHILNTFPVNMLSYFTEWSTAQIDGFQSSKLSMSYEDEHFGHQTNLMSAHMMLSLLELINFSGYLAYQTMACQSLKNEFKTFLVENILKKIGFYRLNTNLTSL